MIKAYVCIGGNIIINRFMIWNKGTVKDSSIILLCDRISGCNDDESEFSSTEIQQALFDMKGTYKVRGSFIL